MSVPTSAELSSNWKLLQQRLKAGSSASQTFSKPKRKSAESPAPAANGEPAPRKRKRSSEEPSSASKSIKSSSAGNPSASNNTSSNSNNTNKKTLKRSASAPSLSSSVKTSRPERSGAKKPTAASPASASSSMTPASSATAISASLALWAEDNDIPTADLARAYNLPLTAVNVPTSIIPTADSEVAQTDAATAQPGTTTTLDFENSSGKTAIGKYIAMDCEMVGVGTPPHESSALARVSIVNFHGHVLLDCFVRPKEKVTDWRTWVSGVRPEDMEQALTFEEAQAKVAELMKDRVLVGHAIKNDLEVLLIGHPKRDIRDTSRHPGFRKLAKGRTPALKKLAKELLGIEIQGGQHSSIEDARACMLLYRRYKDEFEREHEKIWPSKPKNQRKAEKRKKKKTGQQQQHQQS